MAERFVVPEADAAGRFGEFGGRFVPETLMAPVEELTKAYAKARADASFRRELHHLLTTYAGRPTPLTEARRLSAELGARILLKREDLLHTGAHKINNALGQVLLAKRMGKSRVIAETGAGQHGVATATAAALLGIPCVVYMGSVDVERQALNVYRMRLLGTKVVPVDSGSRTLKDAINEAMRDWVASYADTHYVLGSALGPHPYPRMVRDFHAVIGREARAQARKLLGGLPDLVVACVGGGSNAIGLFHAFLPEREVELVGVEAGGRSSAPGEHAARFGPGRVGVLHGTRTLLLADEDGQVLPTHSVSAGLDYPAVGPEHANLAALGRTRYESVTDDEALAAFHVLSEKEGIIPALESAHAVAWVLREAPRRPGATIVLGLSGRGDKDVPTVARLEGTSGVGL
ncbi:MAG TPA: tryptophan synthase subunit beta [Thermoanaerobaculia bacterium]|nr:tryptophan synthase subunit beta [Thermoanaerobaculia bacterium]HPA52258.1 tryptophan synthase subunit beta [Thermoanaerobaculia bacterium]HQN09014.1 tryptophan synthase subunit beta [Thermoanaerobaculia bacterium]HQP87509.1 tryptophan synthase subunit beta [Thermoanaerobaculia bacterium]